MNGELDLAERRSHLPASRRKPLAPSVYCGTILSALAKTEPDEQKAAAFMPRRVKQLNYCRSYEKRSVPIIVPAIAGRARLALLRTDQGMRGGLFIYFT